MLVPGNITDMKSPCAHGVYHPNGEYRHESTNFIIWCKTAAISSDIKERYTML